MKYNYIARTQKGEVQTGTIEAHDQASALETLQENNLVVIRLRSSEKSPLLGKRIKFLERVKRKETFIFLRELSILISADVPLVQSLKTLSQQTDNPYFKDVLFEVASRVEGGTAFSKALSEHPKVFSNFGINLIKSAEVSGRLQESLLYLADYSEKEYYLISKVKGAMIYPIFILVTFIIIGVIMMITVVPQMKDILEEAGQELPLLTRVILGFSDFVRVWGWLILLLLVGLGFGVFRFVKTKKGKRIWDKVVLRLPLFGKILQQTYLSQFAESLSALIQGGVPIIQALTVSSGIIGNEIYKEIILQAKDKVREGKNISPVLEGYKEFPPLFSQMIKTGEKTGKLDSILGKLATFYNKEVDNIVNNLTRLIEPLLILFLAGAVAVLVIAILLPMYNMVGSI